MAFLAAIPAFFGSLLGGGGAAAGGAAASAGTAAAGTGLSFGSVLQAGGALLSGFSALQAGMYQAKVANMNAEIAAENSKRALERSQQEQLDQDMQTLGLIGQQEAIQSASGTTTTGRSNLLTRKVASRLGRRDAANVREAGRMEAWGFNTDAANFRAQAGLAKSQGVSGLVGGFIDAGRSLVGSSLVGGSRSTRMASRFNDPWYGLRRKTV